MDAIEDAAFTSVGRASGFSGLAIFCLMFGFAFDPALAARVGGGLCLMVSLILAGYALRALKRPYKRTETWLILAKEARPPAAVAQQLIGQVLRETYIWFARQSAVFAIVLLASSIVLDFADIGLWDEPGSRPFRLGHGPINSAHSVWSGEFECWETSAS